MKRYDVVVIGLGIMGSATVWNLAKHGARVLGLEAGGPTHCNGSSHGATRIFRRAYWEGSAYLPLLQLAHEGWTQLQSSCPRPLIIPTGGVFIGPRDTGVVMGSLRTARDGGVPHEQWDAAAVRARLPQFRVEEHMHAAYEPGAYAIAAESARLHMLNEAVSAGVELMYGDAAQALTSSSHHVTVTTRSGRQIEAGAATVTAGPWIPRHLLPELALHLVPKRVPIYWFAPKPGREAQFQKDRFPIFLYECTDGSLLYGIPAGASEEQGVKIGFHNRQQLACDVETAAPAISAEMRGLISKYVSSILPDLIAEPVDEKWCIYTMSPDESFLMGESERQAGVFYASACSGHGFKFAPGIGNALASMALRQAPAVDVAHFLATRLGSGEPAIIGARHFSAG